MGIESTIETPFAEAVRIAGSQSAFARLIGKSQTSVYEWLRDKKPLPAEHVLKVEAATGITRHALRPDLYPDESGHDATRADDRRRPADPAPFGDMEPAR